MPAVASCSQVVIRGQIYIFYINNVHISIAGSVKIEAFDQVASKISEARLFGKWIRKALILHVAFI